nr:MAG TPA: hypothetical protein [Caudoviricetes sp.]
MFEIVLKVLIKCRFKDFLNVLLRAKGVDV